MKYLIGLALLLVTSCGRVTGEEIAYAENLCAEHLGIKMMEPTFGSVVEVWCGNDMYIVKKIQ